MLFYLTGLTCLITFLYWYFVDHQKNSYVRLAIYTDPFTLIICICYSLVTWKERPEKREQFSWFGILDHGISWLFLYLIVCWCFFFSLTGFAQRIQMVSSFCLFYFISNFYNLNPNFRRVFLMLPNKHSAVAPSHINKSSF